jgi:hypothetical protein
MQRALDLASKAMQSGHPDAAALDLIALFEKAGAPVKEQTVIDAEKAAKEKAAAEAKAALAQNLTQRRQDTKGEGEEEEGGTEEGIEGPQGEGAEAEGQPAGEALESRPSHEGTTNAGKFESMSLSAAEVILVLAQRELREHGKVTIQAKTLAEAKEKAEWLRKAGLGPETPIEVAVNGLPDGETDKRIGAKYPSDEGTTNL